LDSVSAVNLSDSDSKPQSPIGVMMEIFCAVGLRIVQVNPEVMTALIAESTTIITTIG